MNKANSTAKAVLIVLVAGAFFAVAMLSNLPPDDDSADYGHASAYMAGQTFIRKMLKNPNAAKFDKIDSADGFHYSRHDGLFEVGGTVRSTNSYGAIVPASWRCVVESKGNGHFDLHYLKLGDQENGTYPKDKIE